MPPPPIKLNAKNSPANQTLTTTATAQDARLLVRETLRISASLASSAPPVEPLPLEDRKQLQLQLGRGRLDDDFVGSSLRLICCEEIDGRRWNYVAEPDSSSGTFKKGSFRALGLHSPQPPLQVSNRCFFSFPFYVFSSSISYTLYFYLMLMIV